ncbi:hypothetical protein F511_35640 [Dorcoceras hygrometricum]|uniref:Ubiquitin-like protease family profile domain-containing protein n=1 Tax=Dorcoceras hygrometricum TaxID=472368 RepID=A0A2Z7BJ94_9LAMI|nr:hypothetical protein F511_35640 [Dorcoceras hygrometricum]
MQVACGMLPPTDAELLSAHYIPGVVSNECAVTRRMSELMSHGLKVVCSQRCLSPTPRSTPSCCPPHASTPPRSPNPRSTPPRSPPHASTPPRSPPHASTPPRSPPHSSTPPRSPPPRSPPHASTLPRSPPPPSPPHASTPPCSPLPRSPPPRSPPPRIPPHRSPPPRSPSHVSPSHLQRLEERMTVVRRQKGAEKIPSTDSPDGFELALSMLPHVSEVTWTGSPEVAGWTKVARMFQLMPVPEEESGSRESTHEAVEEDHVEGNQTEGSTKSIPEAAYRKGFFLDMATPGTWIFTEGALCEGGPTNVQNVLVYTRGEIDDWPTISWDKAAFILVPHCFNGHWVLVRIVPKVKKLSILDSDRSVDSNGKILLDLITPLARMMPHILVAMGVQTDTDTQWNIVRPKEFPKQSLSGECGVYAIAAATFTLAEQNVYTLNDAGGCRF